jgi:hypothetical protein
MCNFLNFFTFCGCCYSVAIDLKVSAGDFFESWIMIVKKNNPDLSDYGLYVGVSKQHGNFSIVIWSVLGYSHKVRTYKEYHSVSLRRNVRTLWLQPTRKKTKKLRRALGNMMESSCMQSFLEVLI